MKVTEKDRCTKHVNNHQATWYVPKIEAFKDRHWESILEAMQAILSENNRQKWSKSLSSWASLDFDIEEAEVENYVHIDIG